MKRTRSDLKQQHSRMQRLVPPHDEAHAPAASENNMTEQQPHPDASDASDASDLHARLATLEARIHDLQQQNAALRAELEHARATQPAPPGHPPAIQFDDALFRALVEAAPVAIGIDQDGRKRYANPATEALMGYTLEELRAMTTAQLVQLVHPDSHEEVMAREQARQRGETPPNPFIMHVIDRSGQHHWLEVTSVPIALDGRPAVLTISVDITQRHHAEAARQEAYQQLERLHIDLQRNRDLLRLIFDTIDDGLVLLDSEGRILITNQATAALLGAPLEDVLNRHWSDFCRRRAPGERPAFPGGWVLDTLRNGQPYRRRERLLRDDGNSRVLDMQTLPISYTAAQHAAEVAATKTDHSAVDLLVLHIADVTERIQLEALQIERERSAASRRMTEIVAHEVNTPLQTIMTSLEMMMPATGEEEPSDFLVLAQSEIERIGRILRQLKDLYRHTPDWPGPVQLNDLIEQVLLLLHTDLERCTIVVQRNLDPTLPNILGRPDQIAQVLLNVVLNAIDAMPQGGTLRLTSRIESGLPGANAASGAAHATAIIEISDTGIGLDPTMQTRIFQPFFTTKPQGSGLGLAISQRIVTQHGGSISVKSAPNAGTTFIIGLPTKGEMLL
jgi:PAS domain S-box-containing protein